jgi:PhnB protein
MSGPTVRTSIAPWLAVSDGAEAVAFYSDALGAVVAYRLDGPGGSVAVARLEVDGAAFWLQEDGENAPQAGGPAPVRMILTVDDPDPWFDRATAAGARPIVPVTEAHGWRAGRVTDPFGHDWEFATPLGPHP